MNKIILADSQAIFRAGTAKVLTTHDELRIIAQCADLERLLHAITTFPGAVVLFAASMRPDMARMRKLLETAGRRGIVIAENSDSDSGYILLCFHCVLFHNVIWHYIINTVRL